MLKRALRALTMSMTICMPLAEICKDTAIQGEALLWAESKTQIYMSSDRLQSCSLSDPPLLQCLA